MEVRPLFTTKFTYICIEVAAPLHPATKLIRSHVRTLPPLSNRLKRSLSTTISSWVKRIWLGAGDGDSPPTLPFLDRGEGVIIP